MYATVGSSGKVGVKKAAPDIAHSPLTVNVTTAKD